MIVYHGTTAKRAQRICQDGFLPRKPSRRVWFAESRAYAERRGRTQARRSRDRHVVLTCDLDLGVLRNSLGSNRVIHQHRVIAIRGDVPVTVLRSWPGAAAPATTPDELARWINSILRLKSHRGVSPKDQGVHRLSSWVIHRLQQQRQGAIKPTEILDMARRWLPEYLEGVSIDARSLHATRRPSTIEVEVDYPELAGGERLEQALELLEADSPSQRIKGIKTLAALDDPDRFEWGAMMLDDDSPDVRIQALRLIAGCEHADPDTIKPFAESEDRRIRAAGIAAMIRHSGDDAPGWYRRGLTDPWANVRLDTVAQMQGLDPAVHRELFELALYDPHAHVQQRAERLTRGRGYAKAKW